MIDFLWGMMGAFVGWGIGAALVLLFFRWQRRRK